MIKLPLDITTKKEVKEVRSTILHHLGDKLYQRHPEKYDDVDVPEPLKSSKALGTAPRSKRATIGSIISFKNECPFAMLFLKYDPQDGIHYSLGSHAGWHKRGTEEDIIEYYKAFDTLLDRLGVLKDAYEFSCPCGDTEIISGGYVAVREYINEHNEVDHTERRISNSVLFGREVTTAPSTQVETSQQQHAEG
jgi:hypothetical protein